MLYDAENRLKSYTKASATTTYGYDGDGRRVKKVVGSGSSAVTTVFVYNVSGQLIAEYTDPSQPIPGGGGTSYLTTDHLGSTRVVTDANGSVKARHDYLPFGEELSAGIGGRTTGMKYDAPDSTKQRFTQKERDSESGLDYFLARYYSSAQGRFTSPDEFAGGPEELFDFADDAADNPTFYADLTNPQSLNKYQYCYNNPLLYVDPNGHDPGQDPIEIVVAYEKAQVKGAVNTVWGALTFQFRAITQPKKTFEEVKQTLQDVKETIKADIDIVTHPKQAAEAVVTAVKQDPKKAAEILGDTSGKVAATIALGKGAKALGAEVQASNLLSKVNNATKLGGNQNVGAASASVINRAGQKFTGSGSTPIVGRPGSTTRGSVSRSGNRVFRAPQLKRTGPHAGQRVANFETKSPKANVHVPER